ncbi:MAG: sigma-54-dependent Fis family transcriptional regulator [Deltaproteobacteria bacterium]|nr:sigma-54-dependent Fis family transcriptional regulator [Deltaproteobacteria bacterium]
MLLLERDDSRRAAVRDALQSCGAVVGDVPASCAAPERHGVRGGFDVALWDGTLTGRWNLDDLQRFHAAQPEIAVVVTTARDSAAFAVTALRRGAHHVVVRPARLEELLRIVADVALATRVPLPAPAAVEGGCVVAGAAMREVMDTLRRVADSAAPVLLLGETGVGKDVVARLLHARSARAAGPFVAVNCAALPVALAESELFGHERGAFTGATADRPGRFAEADGGTLLLDEVGELHVRLQAKLLRVLQDGTLPRVGGPTHRADVRVVASTHRDLRADMRHGRFRSDLFHRLNVLAIRLPPLRERVDEIPALATHLLHRLAVQEQCVPRPLLPNAIRALQEHAWPGNVRELENLLRRTLLTRPGSVISAAHLAWPEPGPLPAVTAAPLATPAGPAPARGTTMRSAAMEREATTMLRALEVYGGNVREAARSLGISRATYYRKARRLGLRL